MKNTKKKKKKKKGLKQKGMDKQWKHKNVR